MYCGRKQIQNNYKSQAIKHVLWSVLVTQQQRKHGPMSFLRKTMHFLPCHEATTNFRAKQGHLDYSASISNRVGVQVALYKPKPFPKQCATLCVLPPGTSDIVRIIISSQ